MPEIIDQLQTCLEGLQAGKSDEERMVSLTLLPRLLTNDEQSMLLAFECIPWKFINRLLITRDDALLMPEIALGIWSSFTPISALQPRSELIKRIPACAKLIPEDNIEMQINILRGLIDLAQAVPGRHALMTECVFDSLKFILSKEKDETTSLALYILSILSDHVVATGIQFNILDQFLISVATICKNSVSAIKFQALDVAVKLLCLNQNVYPFSSQNKSTDLSIAASSPLFKAALKDILRNKLNMKQRDSIMMLSGMLYQRFGLSWLTIASHDAMGKATGMSNGQLLTLIVHMTCAEIRVMLDSTERIMRDDQRLDTLLPFCYQTLEHVVQLLVTDSEATMNLDSTLLGSIRNAITETFLAVIAFLVERLDFYTLEPADAIIDNSSTLLSLRAYSCYISEESEVSVQELERLIPLVIYVSNRTFKSIEIDTMMFITPLLDLITSEPELMQFYLANKGHVSVINWFAAQNEINEELCIAVTSVLLNIVVSAPDQIKGDASFARLIGTVSKHLPNGI